MFDEKGKDGSTVRYAPIFAKKYGALVRYVFFCNGTGKVRWYALLIKNPKLFAHYAGFLYTEAKKR